MGLEHEHQR
jgi:hypothetical protein